MMSAAGPYERAAVLQRKLAPMVCNYDDFESPKTFCGADVSYSGDRAYCAAVVMNGRLELLESRESTVTIRSPYVPGYFMLREAPAIKRILSRVRMGFDILLIDGHGVLHPRRCGLASFIGVTLNRPTIGVAKSLLCGTVRGDNFVEHQGEILGYALRMGSGAVYVSTGHRVGVDTAVKLVRMLTRPGQNLPEPSRIADEKSKQKKRKELRL